MSETRKDECAKCGKYNGAADSSDWCRCPRQSDPRVTQDHATPPAAETGEPVAWAVVGRDAGLMHTAGLREEAEAFRIQLAPSWADGDSWRVVPIHYPAALSAETGTP